MLQTVCNNFYILSIGAGCYHQTDQWLSLQIFWVWLQLIYLDSSLLLLLLLSLSLFFLSLFPPPPPPPPDQGDKPKIHEKVNQLWVSAVVWGREEVGLWPSAAMPPSILDKALIGVAGAAGAGILAWQTQFPWIKYDIQIIQVRATLIQPFWTNLYMICL